MPRTTRSISRAELTAAQDRFLEAWGRLGPAWGISRTVAEVHALLYIAGRPLNTDDVMHRLRISRGNASTSLRSLVEWGLISRIHKRPDRKEYFQAEQDVWTMARAILRERLRREIHPTLAALYEIREATGDTPTPTRKPAVLASIGGDAKPSGPPTPDEIAAHNKRLDGLLNMVQTIDRLSERFVGVAGSEGKGLRFAASVLAKIV